MQVVPETSAAAAHDDRSTQSRSWASKVASSNRAAMQLNEDMTTVT